jgi:NitT/TauT family transport system ATP-binding protein
MTAVLSTTGLTKQFAKGDTATVALREFSLTVDEGSFVTVLGRSGYGKSTMLNLLAGLTTPSQGAVTYRDRTLSGPTVEIGYLTQHDTLMPWRDVLRNVEMPLEIRGVAVGERRRIAAELVHRVGLAGWKQVCIAVDAFYGYRTNICEAQSVRGRPHLGM